MIPFVPMSADRPVPASPAATPLRQAVYAAGAGGGLTGPASAASSRPLCPACGAPASRVPEAVTWLRCDGGHEYRGSPEALADAEGAERAAARRSAQPMTWEMNVNDTADQNTGAPIEAPRAPIVNDVSPPDAAPLAPLLSYEAFCATKLRTPIPTGIVPAPPLPELLYPFQRDCAGWALERGRAALFEDCGLGKTFQELAWADAVLTHGRVATPRALILAPLAVAGQTVREGKKLGLDVTYARNASEQAKTGITITNYERLDSFNPDDFSAVVLDESSILKSFMGSTKQRLLAAFSRTPYRLCGTATPAPNDHMELGNHAEFLGVLTSHEMLARWFLNDTSTMGTYKLMGHAVEPFWDWVSSWARCLGSPADLGYDATGYVLPELVQHVHTLDVDVVTGRADGQLYRSGNLSATNVHKEKRLTLPERARKVAEIVRAEPGESWCIWTDTDYEDEALRAVLPDAVSVRGSDSIESKEKALLGFSDGSIRTIITKPRIAGFGLNWQHCARTVYAGPSFSYEAYYQTVRRFWRFGQTRPVDVHVAMGRTEVDVWAAMQRKAADHEAMKREMFAAMRRASAKTDDRAVAYAPVRKASLPAWITNDRRTA